MAESIIRTLLEITAYSGIIWAATMLFKRIFRRKMSPALHVAVWTLFILRLLIPVTWESGIRLAPVPEQAVREAAPSANPAPERFFSGASPAGLSSGESAKTPVSKGAGTGEPAAILGAAPVAAQGPDVWETLTFVWIAGAGVMIALSLSGYRKLRRQVFELELPCPARLEELFEECRRELGVSERVSLVVQRRLAGPALMFPDVVVLPESALLLGSDRLRMALRHELAHYRRKDQIKAVLLSALRAVYWFNPFVWLAAREIREDIETACDGTVVSGLSSSSRAFYAQTVLFLFGRGEGAVLGMASGGARKNAERRIRGIYLSKKSRGATRLSAVLLAACVGLCCFTTACQPTPDAQAVAQVSRIEGDGTQETDDTPRYQPAAYKAEGCWQDASSENDGRFTVSADVDVLIPEVEKHPIQKLTRRTFTEDEARKLTDYLAAQAGVTGDFYRLPLQMTKAEYEDQIVALRETLAMDEQNGADEDAIQADRDSIAALEEKWREAPEEASRIPATMEFAYAIDYEGNPITEDGERFIDAGAATQDGTVATVSVRSGPLGEGDPDGAAFTFSTGSWRDELTDRQALADASAERESLAEFEGPREDEIERIDAVEAAVNKRA